MEKEIEWIKDKIERLWPKNAIENKFRETFFDKIYNFEEIWKEAHKVAEQPKEEKKEDNDLKHRKEKALKALKFLEEEIEILTEYRRSEARRILKK